MKTVLEPKGLGAKTWGKQKINENALYRPMKYIIRVKHDDGMLLHNVATGQLILLSEEEYSVFDSTAVHYSPALDEFIESRFLVPVDYDECKSLMQVRKVMRKIGEREVKSITYYTRLFVNSWGKTLKQNIFEL